MASVSKTYSAAGQVSSELLARNGDKLSYALTGSFDATIVLEKSENGGLAWESVVELTAAASDTIDVSLGSSNAVYRGRASVYASGSPVLTISDVDITLVDVDDFAGNDIYRIDEDGFVFEAEPQTEVSVGAVAGSGVSLVEYGDGAVHKTVFTLDELQVDVTSTTDGNGVGGTKIYDFPEGYIQIHGCTANLSLGVLTEDDFTDGTPEGDIGIGTVAPANADALGTDATDDNIATATAFAMTDYVDASVSLPPETSLNIDGTATAVDLYVNALVDAADIDDSTTGELLVSGTITLVWSHLGDY